jgi:hypothetical protein
MLGHNALAAGIAAGGRRRASKGTGVLAAQHGVELRNSADIAEPDEMFTRCTLDVFGTTGDFATLLINL